jgi:anti-anti-sigma factor
METTSFTAHVRKQLDTSIIDLEGEMDAFADKSLTVAYNEAASDSPHTIVLNFSQVSYINSTGIALIVSLLAKTQKTNCNLVVYGLTDYYQELFDITSLSDFMAIYPDESRALAGVH